MNLTQFVHVDGVHMPLRHPKTGDPLTDAEGNPVTLTLVGPDSPEFQSVEHTRLNRLLQSRRHQGDAAVDWTAEDIEADNTETLVRVTKGWSGIGIDEDETPFSPEAARRLYTDPRTRFIRRQAKAFLDEAGNFFGPWAISSSPTPNGSSH